MIFTMLHKNKIWKVVRSCDTSSYHIWSRISVCVDTDFFPSFVFHPRETLVFEPEKSLVYNKKDIPYNDLIEIIVVKENKNIIPVDFLVLRTHRKHKNHNSCLG